MADRKHLWICLVLGVILAGCTLTTPQGIVDDKAVITIVEPVEGAQFQVGELVRVRALVSSASGAQDVDLYINGNIVRRDQLNVPLRQGNILQPWQPADPGDYLVQLTMTTAGGAAVQSNAILITVIGGATPPTTEVQPPTVTVQPPTVTFQPTTFVPEPVITVTPTLTLTRIQPSSITPSLTWYPTNTYTPTLPTLDPLTTPEPIAPSGTYSCRSPIFLEWHTVYSPNGISYYEWVVEGPNGQESGTTTEYKVEYFIPGCSASYQWKVRAVDTLGNIGPYTDLIPFTIE